MKDIGSGIIAILVAIIGVATLGVVLSTKSNTSAVITSVGTAMSTMLKAATAPITG